MEFYGKTCNYAFPYREEGYEVFFLGNNGMAECREAFKDIDSCILWGAYQEFEEENTDIESGNMLICESGSMWPVMWATSQDSLLEYAWQTLTDVNIDGDGQTEQDWFIFPAGTQREEIWHWFDRHYSEGVGGLMGCSIDIPALPWADATRKTEKGTGDGEQTFPWIFVTKNGVTDQEAKTRVVNTGLMLIDTSWWLDKTDNAAFISAPVPGTQDEQIVAAVYEDYLVPGRYLLDIYDNEELLFSGDGIGFPASGIEEAAQISSVAILNAIHAQKERVNEFQKRYVQF